MSAYCVSCMSYQVEISAADRSLVQRSPTKYDMAECDLETAKMKKPRSIRSTRAVEP
jgi:hypothetical protein